MSHSERSPGHLGDAFAEDRDRDPQSVPLSLPGYEISRFALPCFPLRCAALLRQAKTTGLTQHGPKLKHSNFILFVN